MSNKSFPKILLCEILPFIGIKEMRYMEINLVAIVLSLPTYESKISYQLHIMS